MSNKNLSSFLLAAILLLSFGSAQAKEFSIGTQSESKLVDSVIVYNPSPELPTELKSEAFKAYCTARFHIEPTGKFEVKLLSSTENEEIDHLVISTLKKWKFKPATLDDQPVASTRKIKIELEIE